mmetsp:Transcript_52494/g.85753  ORF Transcript_52494/g.85753 Transcript_52494/m.85753 type:complete len:226 (-) Transcript_52494:27-704(-)
MDLLIHIHHGGGFIHGRISMTIMTGRRRRSKGGLGEVSKFGIHGLDDLWVSFGGGRFALILHSLSLRSRVGSIRAASSGSSSACSASCHSSCIAGIDSCSSFPASSGSSGSSGSRIGRDGLRNWMRMDWLKRLTGRRQRLHCQVRGCHGRHCRHCRHCLGWGHWGDHRGRGRTIAHSGVQERSRSHRSYVLAGHVCGHHGTKQESLASAGKEQRNGLHGTNLHRI